ncbi:MAG: AraC family transcriptional regulator [Opitutales bacterium]
MGLWIEALDTGREIYSTPAYQFDNRLRGGTEGRVVVIQRTLRGRAFFDDADGNRHAVPAGSLMIFQHGEPTRYGYPPEATEPYHLEFITFRPEGAAPLLLDLRRLAGPVLRFDTGGEADRTFGDLVDRVAVRRFADVFDAAAASYSLIMALYREVTGPEPAPEDPVEAARRFFHRRFREPVGLPAAAEAAGLSVEHLCRRFKAEQGLSPGAYLRQLRLQAAAERLRASRLPVNDIARQCGYLDVDSFSRAFARAYGCRPSQWRAG